MCDCYNHKCKKCNRLIPMHLGDFNTSASEIDVFCWRHLPKRNAIFFHIKDARDDIKKEYSRLYESERKFIGKTIAIRPLTGNAIDNQLHNHPNLILEWDTSEAGG